MTASNSGFGLNNEELYGTRWYYISPDELIKRGRIVPPRLHIMHAETVDEGASIVSQVTEIAQEQIKLTETTLEFSKVLFAMSGTDDVKTVEDNIKDIRDTFPNHNVFTITSRNGAQINGVEVKRKQFMQELKTCENALIFHYDILSEGIDIDGITGVAIMRNMNQAKLLQTIGRAVRIYKANPKLKQQALVSVPVINSNDETHAFVQDIIIAMRDGGFEINAEQVLFTGKNGPGIHEDYDLDDQYELNKKKKAQTVVQNVFHDLEQAEWLDSIKEMSDEELIADLAI